MRRLLSAARRLARPPRPISAVAIDPSSLLAASGLPPLLRLISSLAKARPFAGPHPADNARKLFNASSHAPRELGYAQIASDFAEEPLESEGAECTTNVRRNASDMLTNSIEELCRAGRVDQAIEMLEVKVEGVEPNVGICNVIVCALSEEKRFVEALGMVEKYPLYGIAPNISTYNSLIRGFCKHKDIAGANRILKLMMGRGITPTPTTYNHFFRAFSQSEQVQEGMNLYEKLIESGYSPNRSMYRVLIKMLHDNHKLELAVRIVRDMNKNGFDSDSEMSTLLIHMLCRLCKWEEACDEFEKMVWKGIVPEYAAYQRIIKDLKRLGKDDMVRRISEVNNEVLRRSKLVQDIRERSYEMRRSIVEKAMAMSEALKVSRERKRVADLRERKRLYRNMRKR